MVMFNGFVLLICVVLAIHKFASSSALPSIRLVSNGNVPELKMQPEHKFHLFLSHIWSSGQDQMATVKRELIPDPDPDRTAAAAAVAAVAATTSTPPRDRPREGPVGTSARLDGVAGGRRNTKPEPTLTAMPATRRARANRRASA